VLARRRPETLAEDGLGGATPKSNVKKALSLRRMVTAAQSLPLTKRVLELVALQGAPDGVRVKLSVYGLKRSGLACGHRRQAPRQIRDGVEVEFVALRRAIGVGILRFEVVEIGISKSERVGARWSRSIFIDGISIVWRRRGNDGSMRRCRQAECVTPR